MTSRRAFLAWLGTAGTVGLAGCSSLPFGDDESDSQSDVSLPAGTVEPIAWPDSPFPVSVPATLAETHRERARELLAAVPTEPSVPNGAVAEEIRSERERAASRLEADVDEPWATEALSQWRSQRNTAATVRGAYRAATGENDAATVAEGRQAVREELGSFVTDHEYRASAPLEAVLVHAPIEDLVSDCRRRVRPEPPYPADSISSPFQAGDAVGRVEHARATLHDARRLQDLYLTERADATSHWAALSETSDRLRLAVIDGRSTVRDFLNIAEPPFDADLEGTAARSLFRQARQHVESKVRTHEDVHDRGAYAAAAIEAGRALCAVEALRMTIEEIRDGAHQDPVTVESVGQTADRAREAISTATQSENRRLAAHILRPALGIFNYVPRRIEEGYADAPRVQGELLRAERYARTVPEATTFVSERLE